MHIFKNKSKLTERVVRSSNGGIADKIKASMLTFALVGF